MLIKKNCDHVFLYFSTAIVTIHQEPCIEFSRTFTQQKICMYLQ